ncbi:MAG: Asp-tRNA(Asn)/Glu-tRNA(Gln) amidotransferase subunit GatB [Armatimonadetes bacterium]|nr:Asp-tRNA(Asn)/Glu-tRNA(Gln) amidotransferase subunit GatB [Candidatus Hippobium faecium]
MREYKPTIGMEVHIELQTKTKMFCGCKVDFGGEPNTRCCPVCIGLPGALPAVNKAAIDTMLKAALALNCNINYENYFHRKNYYYPDLPKNFQTSQYDCPLGYNGYLEICVGGKTKKIDILRVHMEEDTGKLLHLESGKSLIDYNRSGTPLMEIVTQVPPRPGFDTIESAEEAREYVQRLRQLMVYIGVSDCKMEEGSMRCEPNISVRPADSDKLGTKTELKNLNSFRVVYLASDYEIKRQSLALDMGEKIVQETRRWDDSKGETTVMRVKESAQEYRYFPEPDLCPIVLDKDYCEEIRATIGERPLEKERRFISEYSLPESDAQVLTDDKKLADFYEEIAKVCDPKKTANWILTELLKLTNQAGVSVEECNIKAGDVIDILTLIDKGVVNRNTAKTVFAEMFDTGKDAKTIIKEKGLEQVSDTGAIEKAIEEILAGFPKEVERYKAGEVKLMGFFTGQIMRQMKGKANPGVVNQILKQKLN